MLFLGKFLYRKESGGDSKEKASQIAMLFL